MTSALASVAVYNAGNVPAEQAAEGHWVPIPFDVLVETAAPSDAVAEPDAEGEADGMAAICVAGMAALVEPAPVVAIPLVEKWGLGQKGEAPTGPVETAAQGPEQPSTPRQATELLMTAVSVEPAGSDSDASMADAGNAIPELIRPRRGDPIESTVEPSFADAMPARAPAGSDGSFHMGESEADGSSGPAATQLSSPAVSGAALANCVVPALATVPDNALTSHSAPAAAATLLSLSKYTPAVLTSSAAVQLPAEESGGRRANDLPQSEGREADGLRLHPLNSGKPNHRTERIPEGLGHAAAAPPSGKAGQAGDDRVPTTGKTAPGQAFPTPDASGLGTEVSVVVPLMTPPSPSSPTLIHGAALDLSAPPSDRAGEIGRQLAASLTDLSGRPVEVTLAPEELGRITMTISSSDGGLTLTLVAERPETLELMRRNIDQLAQEFRDLGFGALNFAFSHDGQPSHDTRASRGGEDEHAITTDQPAQTTPVHRQSAAIHTETLDLRV